MTLLTCRKICSRSAKGYVQGEESLFADVGFFDALFQHFRDIQRGIDHLQIQTQQLLTSYGTKNLARYIYEISITFN